MFDNITSHISFKCIHLHRQKIYNSFEIRRCSIRYFNYNSFVCQFLFDTLYRHKEVSSHFIHLVDESHPRNSIFICLSPNSFWLRFYSLRSIKYCNSSIQNSQRSLYFNCKVYVSWGINQVDLMIMPKTCSSSWCNCNSSFFFLFHPVHICSSVMSFSDFVFFTCIEKNSLTYSSFSGINVSHDTNVSNLVQRCCLCHFFKYLKY